VVAISPWNFPLAIFTGQIAAALAAGNVVIAKPAEQTPLIAALAVRLLHGAGVPRAALQLLPGDGSIGARLTADARLHAVLFTGSTEVAALIDRALARFPAGADPLLVAETGGQNAMIVDSSAQPEQVVQDALQSAFGSAGQRCSALRILCLQEEIADPVLAMLAGAAAELRLGDPALPATDIGPVIDQAARALIEAHVGAAPALAAPRAVAPVLGCFVAPAIVPIASISALTREVFGPVLHVLRYRREALGELVEAINATGYALTCGIHSRIDETIDFVADRIRAGNIYVNRNMIGAVVGVQPFGGEGLSGTGPKAGGPWTVAHLTAPAGPPPAAAAPAHGSSYFAPERLGALRSGAAPPALQALQQWAHPGGHDALVPLCAHYAADTPIGCRLVLPGPTGESNVLRYRARGRVLCLGAADVAVLAGTGTGDLAPSADPAALAGSDEAPDLLFQLAAVAATGNRALCVEGEANRQLVAALPPELRALVDWTADWIADRPAVSFEVALLSGSDAAAAAVRGVLAARAGARISLLRPSGGRYELYRMVAEQVLTINTAAAGGNATLMSLQPA